MVEGGSWELVLLLPPSVLGLLVAGEGLCIPGMAGRTFIKISFFSPLKTVPPFVAGLPLVNLLSQSSRYWHDRRVLPCPSAVMHRRWGRG